MDKKRFLKNTLPILLFCITAALIATLWGYNNSESNAEEQLPLIMRAVDPTFLINDFFTNTSSLFGPRTIYTEFIALFVRIFSLPAVLFALTLIANIAIAYISSLTARFFFEGSKFSAILAAAGVLTIKTFWLGYSNIIYRNFLEPAHLAMPFLLLGFYLILKKKYISSSIAFGIAALFHPLLGLETGWLLFGVSFFLYFVQLIGKKTTLKNGITLAIAGVVLVCFSIGLLLPYSTQPSIPDDLFIKLVAYVRHPHHYVPSTFELWQYGQAAVYLAAFGLIFWNALNNSEKLRKNKTFLILTGGLIFLLCIGGYLFVEVWPSRIWTSAQMFRLPYLIKWFSIVLIAGWVGVLIDQSEQGGFRIFGLSAGIGMVTPVSLAITAIAAWGRRVILPRIKPPKWLHTDLLILALTVASLFFYKPELRTWSLFLLFFGLIWIMYLVNWKWPGTVISSVVLLAVSGIFIVFSVFHNAPGLLKYEMPKFSLFNTSNEIAELGVYAKSHSPADAVYLTPPKFGEFRYMAERAIVVDFVAFAFQDESMLEWYNRIVDCYGTPLLYGFNNIPELKRTYWARTDEQLLDLARKYDVDFIVIFKGSGSKLTRVYETESYALIKVDDQP